MHIAMHLVRSVAPFKVSALLVGPGVILLIHACLRAGVTRAYAYCTRLYETQSETPQYAGNPCARHQPLDQEIDTETFNLARPYAQAQRRDSGIPRSSAGSSETGAPQSEASWVKRRRLSVESACSATASVDGDGEPAALEDKVRWTDPNLDEKQQAVVSKQKAKHGDRKVQALIDGALVDAEVIPNLEQKAMHEQRARAQRAKETLAKEKEPIETPCGSSLTSASSRGSRALPSLTLMFTS